MCGINSSGVICRAGVDNKVFYLLDIFCYCGFFLQFFIFWVKIKSLGKVVCNYCYSFMFDFFLY